MSNLRITHNGNAGQLWGVCFKRYYCFLQNNLFSPQFVEASFAEHPAFHWDYSQLSFFIIYHPVNVSHFYSNFYLLQSLHFPDLQTTVHIIEYVCFPQMQKCNNFIYFSSQLSPQLTASSSLSSLNSHQELRIRISFFWNPIELWWTVFDLQRWLSTFWVSTIECLE